MLYGGVDYRRLVLIKIWKKGNQTSYKCINKVQDYFKLKFPKDYTEIIHFFDGYGLKVRGKNGKYYEPMIEIKKGIKSY